MEKKSSKMSVFQLVLIATFLSIIILQSFIPFLGNMPLFVLDITIIHITVILGAIVLGPRAGLILGTAWGICSFIRAFTSGSAISLLVFTNPVIAILPRMAVGFLSGLVYQALAKTKIRPSLSMALVGAFGSLFNTITVLSLIYFIVGPQYAQQIGSSIELLPGILMTLVGTNGVPEAIAAFIIVPIIGNVLMQLMKNRTRK